TRPTTAEWSEFESKLPGKAPQTVWDTALNLPGPHPETRENCPVLYRDRNGWCPYSERVWLGLLYKGIPFDEVLVDNQGSKPRFWYDIGGGTTPAVVWPDGTFQGESLDLLVAMDDRLPADTPQLLPKDQGLRDEALRIASSLTSVLPRRCRPSSRAAFLYRGNGPVPRRDFEASLDELEELLSLHEGPFFLGGALTVADCAWVPFLERFAVQLPLLHRGLDLRDSSKRPRLAAWYDALEHQVPCYAGRVQGDASSWAAVLAVAGYGNAGSAESYQAPENLGLDLGNSVVGEQVWAAFVAGKEGLGKTPAQEAARRLYHNREAIVTDFMKNRSESFERSLVDQALRVCVTVVLADKIYPSLLEGVREEVRAVAKELASYLSKRVCVPRDMGRLPADVYRKKLSQL
ncbi:hypothetical protein CYMTET_12008, partial [Cymbomonas tetramitiformis]